MTIIFQCSRCQRKMSTAEEHAGRKVRCPDCSTLVTVPEPVVEVNPEPPPRPRRPTPAPKTPPKPPPRPSPAPSAEGAPFDLGTGPASGGGGFDWGSTEAAAPVRRLPAGWRRVRLGVDLVYWGGLCLLGSGVLGVLTLVLLVARSRDLAAISQYAALALIVLAGILALVGQFVCVAGPPNFGFKWVALAAAICTLLGFTAPIGFLLWLVFLWGVATALKNRRLATQVIVFLVAALVVPVLLFCLYFGAVLLLATHVEEGGPFLMIIGLVVELALLVWYLTLLAITRSTIDRARTGLGF